MDITIFESLDWLLTNIGQNLQTWFGDHAFNILLILFIAWIIRNFGSQLLARLLETTARSDLYPTKSDRVKRLKTLENLAGDILKIGVYIIAGLMIISELGVDTTPLVASAGAIGLVIGIGAQSLVRDVASGMFIIINNQYRVGDDIELRVGGAMSTVGGIVEDIGVRSTSLRDIDGNLHHIPNGNINVATNKTIGFSAINLDLTVAAESDIEKIRLIINRVGTTLSEDPDYAKKIKEPPQFQRVIGFDSNGIIIKILGKTGSMYASDVEGELYTRLIKEFRKSKIELAPKKNNTT